MITYLVEMAQPSDLNRRGAEGYCSWSWPSSGLPYLGFSADQEDISCIPLGEHEC